MVTTRAVDGVAVGGALQELEAGAGKALGRPTAAMPAAGLPQQPLATVAAASSAPSYKVMPRSAAWTPKAAAFSLSASGYAGSGVASDASATSGSQATGTAVVASKTAVAKTTSAKTTSVKSTSAKSTSAKSTSTKSAASKELAFLDDPTLSIQDKLYQFMALQMKKSNQELKEAMQEYEGKRAQNVAQQKATTSGASGTSGASAGSSSAPAKKSSGGGGLFGMLGDALGGIADAVVGGAESLAKDLGGPLLAAGVTAVGLPFLAPVALQIGGTIGKAAVGGFASLIGDTASSLLGGSSQGVAETLVGAGPGAAATSGSTTTVNASSSTSKATTTAKASSSTSTASGSDDFDERVEAMNLQRLVEKQQAMFGILSNALKAMHDTQMNAIQNVR